MYFTGCPVLNINKPTTSKVNVMLVQQITTWNILQILIIDITDGKQSFPLRNCSPATCLSIYFPAHVAQSVYSYSCSRHLLEDLQNATLCIQWCKEHSETFPETNELDSKPFCFCHTVIYSNFGAFILERLTSKQIRRWRRRVCKRHN